MLAFALSSGDSTLADPGITTEPTGLTETQSRPADLFTAAAVPGRSAALGVCVASPMQQRLEETPRRQPLILNCHITGKKFLIFVVRASFYRSRVQTADGRPHVAATRTLQYAADIASSPNGQQIPVKSLQHRWKHEVQIALLRPNGSHDVGNPA